MVAEESLLGLGGARGGAAFDEGCLRLPALLSGGVKVRVIIA
jgi:hypothetical protein